MKNKITTKDYIEKAIKVHRGKYSYGRTRYIKSADKITVTCLVHGDFTVRAGAHISGAKCKKCKGAYHDLKTFVRFATEKFGKQYKYDKVQYKNSKTKVTILCQIHGEFKQTPEKHLMSKTGCHECGKISRAMSKTTSINDFVEKANLKFNFKYDYSNTKYNKSRNYLDVLCNIDGHGVFSVIANNHLHGQGCPSCNIGGFKMNSPAIIYYLSINNGQAFKIGITNRSVKERFTKKDYKKIQILHQIHYKTGRSAYDEEQRILKEYIMYKYNGEKLLDSGNTELFSRNIL